MAATFRDPGRGEVAPAGPTPFRVLVGGVVAHNDEHRVERSLRSLLDQRLPDGVTWGKVWLVASGCTDRTVDIARALAREDPRVGVVVEPCRRGKAAAIREVLSRAQGDSVVLLNSDAVAHPGAVSALLEKSVGKPRPYAVMGRPVVPETADGDWNRTVRWMWELHHELHADLLADGRGAHLSDELLLLSLPAPATLGEGIINDGSYLGVWLAQNGGGCWYAPEGEVTIDVPRSVPDHLSQRRRIHVGNAQVRRVLGRAPTTFPRYLLEEPARAVETLRSVVRRPGGFRHLVRVAFWELIAHVLAIWDQVPPARDHVRWRRIRPLEGPSGPSVATAPRRPTPVNLEQRVRSLLSVAGEFGTGVPLEELVRLLPEGAPGSEGELAHWLRQRPYLAWVEGGRAFPPGRPPVALEDRRRLGEFYRRMAQDLVRGPLSTPLRWARCIGVSGSAAYGEPRPGDDLDFFVVTRTGALWWFLALTYLSLRIHRWRHRGPMPEPCLNYVLEDGVARAAFEQGRGFLFARESLTVRLLRGDPYFRGLLASAPWMSDEIPRLYASRAAGPEESGPRPAPAAVRALNALLFPLVATYLQLAGLRRNARERRENSGHGAFRTTTSFRRMAFSSVRFEELRTRYTGEGRPHRSPGGGPAPARVPSSR